MKPPKGISLRFAASLLGFLLLSSVCRAAPASAADLWQSLLNEAKATHSSALVLFKEGEAPQSYFRDGKSTKIEAMSVTKSVVALAVGLLITQGKLASVDTPVSEFYPEWRQGSKREITIRHLLTQSSGLQDAGTQAEIYPSPDFVQLALCAELDHDPGTHFFYSNKATNLLVGIVAKAAHEPIDTYLGKQLFAPLGITDWSWSKDDAGNPHGMSGLQIHPEDLAKIGMLMLNRGQWQGKSLLSSAWVTQALSPSALEPSYGWLWWLTHSSESYELNQAWLDRLAASGAAPALIKRLQPLQGHYPDFDSLLQRLEQVLGPQWRDEIRQALPQGVAFIKPDYGPSDGFGGNGYLGQYLIVRPEQRLVAVRMITVEAYESAADSYPDFANRLRTLSTAP